MCANRFDLTWSEILLLFVQAPRIRNIVSTDLCLLLYFLFSSYSQAHRFASWICESWRRRFWASNERTIQCPHCESEISGFVFKLMNSPSLLRSLTRSFNQSKLGPQSFSVFKILKLSTLTTGKKNNFFNLVVLFII